MRRGEIKKRGRDKYLMEGEELLDRTREKRRGERMCAGRASLFFPLTRHNSDYFLLVFHHNSNSNEKK